MQVNAAAGKPAGLRGSGEPRAKVAEVVEVAGSELLVASGNTSAGGGTGAQGLRGGRVPQLGPQGFAGRENSEPNRAAGASGPVTPEASLREGEFYAVKDVSFELRRVELRALGQSEKNCLPVTCGRGAETENHF